MTDLEGYSQSRDIDFSLSEISRVPRRSQRPLRSGEMILESSNDKNAAKPEASRNPIGDRLL